MKKVRWGVLGAARIATVKVIPAMQRGKWCEIAAIASRDHSKAETAAESLGIPKAYGSYDQMLADPEIDAVYNPLPNHLHVPLSIRAAEAGKHVLCEKPIALNAVEALELIAARDRTGVIIGEAFMVQTHPQWNRTIEIVRSGRIGELRFAMGSFGYFNRVAENIRNIAAYGGGGLMDIGCYPIKTTRMVFGEEPIRVCGTLHRDPEFGTDILASAVLEYPSGQCIFGCSTQIVPNQSMQFFGTKGRIHLEIPFNAIPNETSRILIDDGRDLRGGGITVEEFAPCDQYTIQGDLFSRAIREGRRPPVPLEDSVRNMAVIDALFRSAESGKWETVQREFTPAAAPTAGRPS
ncbi:MAG TPA: Gfo/Idh/MocA family oxidoreductase [Bryobacteraceae bacterium]|nr:Gfo/Idh/MocA family oxidoreductase [Bryobacteraceae bacterium]